MIGIYFDEDLFHLFNNKETKDISVCNILELEPKTSIQTVRSQKCIELSETNVLILDVNSGLNQNLIKELKYWSRSENPFTLLDLSVSCGVSIENILSNFVSKKRKEIWVQLENPSPDQVEKFYLYKKKYHLKKSYEELPLAKDVHVISNGHVVNIKLKNPEKISANFLKIPVSKNYVIFLKREDIFASPSKGYNMFIPLPYSKLSNEETNDYGYYYDN